MKKVLQSAALAGITCVLMIMVNFSVFAADNSRCSRDDLKNITDKFFSALEAHNPSAVPLAENARYTENGLEVAIGEGVWKTIEKTNFKRKMVDTKRCGTHTQAIIKEKGQDKETLYGVRLKVENMKITEIEAVVVRGEFVLDVPAIMATKDQDWEDIMPPEQRSSRIAMIAVADDYFELFVKDKKRVVSDLAYSGYCDRWENGTITTKGGMNQDIIMPKHDCSPEGFADMTDTHGPRRFLVDEESGIVVAYVLFNGVWPDFHMFKINNGLVVWIQAYFDYSKEYKTMGWPEEPACE